MKITGWTMVAIGMTIWVLSIVFQRYELLMLGVLIVGWASFVLQTLDYWRGE